MQAILFDMDGTLVDSEPFYYERKLRFLASLDIVVEEAVMRKYVGRNMRDFFHALYDEEQAMNYYDAYRNYIQAYPADYKSMLFPEAKEVLLACKAEGYNIALVSSSPWVNINAMLEQCGFQDMFDVVISGDDHPFAKPNPAVYVEAMDKLSLPPNECIVVEDSNSGIQAGKTAGCFVIAKAKPKNTDIHADVYISSLKEVLEIIKTMECR